MAKIPALQKLTHMRDLWDLQVVRKMYHHLPPSDRRAKGQLFHFSRGQIFLLLEGFLEVADLLQGEGGSRLCLPLLVLTCSSPEINLNCKIVSILYQIFFFPGFKGCSKGLWNYTKCETLKAF